MYGVALEFGSVVFRGRNLVETPAVLDLRVVGISRENTEVPLPNSRVCTMCTCHASLSNSKSSLISFASYLGPSRRSSRTSNSPIPILPPRPPGSQAQVFRSRIDTSAGRVLHNATYVTLELHPHAALRIL